ncbi:MAG: hypothetical protein EOP53_09075 [Sphingobacteriales bacterium]|nr:MAG: hypothetical protein EOP53_09075 [Sphingobacteriales bacterium]
MLSLLVSPLIGFFVVRFSADRNAPDKTQTKADYEKFLSRQKTVLTDAEQDEFSTLLKQFSKGKISKQEFETQAAKFN